MTVSYSHKKCTHPTLLSLASCQYPEPVSSENTQVISKWDLRRLSPDENRIIDIDPKSPQICGLNCTLHNLYREPTEPYQKTYSFIRTTGSRPFKITKQARAELLQLHLFLTLPYSHLYRPRSLKRILAIDMIQTYIERMNPWLETLLICRNDIIKLNKNPHPTFEEEVEQLIVQPNYRMTKPNKKQRWTPLRQVVELQNPAKTTS